MQGAQDRRCWQRKQRYPRHLSDCCPSNNCQYEKERKKHTLLATFNYIFTARYSSNAITDILVSEERTDTVLYREALQVPGTAMPFQGA